MGRIQLLRYSELLNCGCMSIPFSYLGVQIGSNHRMKELWEGIMLKIRKRLAKRKGKFISLTGRVYLIKFVLSALPLFLLSIFKMPKGVRDKIIHIEREFLCGWGHDHRKKAWVNWDIICKPKSEGGLGVLELKNFNKALLGKWK